MSAVCDEREGKPETEIWCGFRNNLDNLCFQRSNQKLHIYISLLQGKLKIWKLIAQVQIFWFNLIGLWQNDPSGDNPLRKLLPHEHEMGGRGESCWTPPSDRNGRTYPYQVHHLSAISVNEKEKEHLVMDEFWVVRSSLSCELSAMKNNKFGRVLCHQYRYPLP